MTDEQEQPVIPKGAKVIDTQASLELTDKIHRLVRLFSRQLAELVAQEIGARAVKIKKKRGPPKGQPMPKSPCPLCKGNPNSGRCYGFICRDCRAGKPIGHRQKVKEVYRAHKYKKKDRLGKDFKVEVPVPTHLPLKPQPVEVEDVEPSFLDSLVEVVTISKKAAPPPESASQPVDSDEGMDFFS